MQIIWKNEGESSTNLIYISMKTEFFQKHNKRSHWDADK